MNAERGSAAIHIKLADGKITVSHTGFGGAILHYGSAQEGTWNAIWAVIRGMVSNEKIEECQHLDYYDTMTGAVCNDCGFEEGGEEE